MNSQPPQTRLVLCICTTLCLSPLLVLADPWKGASIEAYSSYRLPFSVDIETDLGLPSYRVLQLSSLWPTPDNFHTNIELPVWFLLTPLMAATLVGWYGWFRKRRRRRASAPSTFDHARHGTPARISPPDHTSAANGGATAEGRHRIPRCSTALSITGAIIAFLYLRNALLLAVIELILVLPDYNYSGQWGPLRFTTIREIGFAIIAFIVAMHVYSLMRWRTLDGEEGRPPHCRSCDYNLTGNTSGRCPECGAPAPPRSQSRPVGRIGGA